jgi:hypothetical protein
VTTAEAMMGNYLAKILGSIEIGDKAYSVRDRSPWKDTYPALLQDAGLSDTDFPVAEKEKWALASRNDTQDDLEKMLDQWAQVMAVAHFEGAKNAKLSFARDFRMLLTSGSDTTAGVAEFALLTQTYAENYATQVEADFAAFRRWGSCVSNVCLWPPLPPIPGTDANLLVILVGVGLGGAALLFGGLTYWHFCRIQTGKLHAALNTQDPKDTADEPVWSGHVVKVQEGQTKYFKAAQIASAEIDEYAQLDKFEGHN